MTLYFINGGDIPYVALSEYIPFLAGLLNDRGKGLIPYDIERRTKDGEVVYSVMRADNMSELQLYPERDLMIFDNFNSFTKTVGTKALVSTLDMPEAEEIDMIAYARTLLGYDTMTPDTQEQVEDILDDDYPGENGEGKSEAYDEVPAEETFDPDGATMRPPGTTRPLRTTLPDCSR